MWRSLQALTGALILVFPGVMALGDEGKIRGAILPKVPAEWSPKQLAENQKSPQNFWLEKKVYPRRGIVVEDEFYVVDGEKKECWVLDQFTVGTVESVETFRNMVVANVKFEDTLLWIEGAVSNVDLGAARGAQELLVERYGEWVDQTIVANPELGGFRVNREDAGVVISGSPREPGPVTVRIPVSLLSVARPGVGARVRRSADWCWGFSDGGDIGLGTGAGGENQVDEELFGTTLGTVDEAGLVEVEWDYTFERKFVRFGTQEYYDIVEVEPGEQITDPERVEALREALEENSMVSRGSGGNRDFAGGGRGGRSGGGGSSRGGYGSSAGGRGSSASEPGSGSSPQGYGSRPPPGSSPQNYGSQPPSGSSPQNYGSQPPSGSSPQNGGSRPPAGSSPQSYGSQPPSE